MDPGVLHVGASTTLRTALPHADSLDAAAEEATTRQATGGVLNGRKRRRCLQDGRLSAAVEGAPPRESLPPESTTARALW